MNEQDGRLPSAPGAREPSQQAVSSLRASPPSADDYAVQMAEIPKVEGIIDQLLDELRRCPATPRGYRQASELRNNIRMWEDMKARMLENAQAIEARRAETEGFGAQHESAVGTADAPNPHRETHDGR